MAKSSVSLWCREVEVDLALLDERRRARWLAGNAARRPSRLRVAKEAEIERCRIEAAEWVGSLSERDLFIAGIALYAGEGFKTGSAVGMANSDPRIIVAFLTWLRTFFDIDERRLRLRLYLHDGLDLERANLFWHELTGIPLTQFGKPYRAVADASRRKGSTRWVARASGTRRRPSCGPSWR